MAVGAYGRRRRCYGGTAFLVTAAAGAAEFLFYALLRFPKAGQPDPMKNHRSFDGFLWISI